MQGWSCSGVAWPRRRRGAAWRGCTVAAARVVRVGSRGSGWFKEPWPKISACGIGRKGCGHRGRGSRGDTARPLQRGEGRGRGRDCQVGPACQWWGARERLSGSLWVGPASREWRGGVRGWGASGPCGASLVGPRVKGCQLGCWGESGPRGICLGQAGKICLGRAGKRDGLRVGL